jgi:hypothetical protein
MGKAKRGALAGLGWIVWKAGSRIGWRYASNKMDQRNQATDPGERSAAAAERTADGRKERQIASRRQAPATAATVASLHLIGCVNRASQEKTIVDGSERRNCYG